MQFKEDMQRKLFKNNLVLNSTPGDMAGGQVVEKHSNFRPCIFLFFKSIFPCKYI